ncbi:hypothetical protein EYF80_024997 [Liparis tanakae]|uniref:Uncharacterized protein n=1 Tax=Liparis tanakae TaxID=230148 RepID=A0A4Z2HIX0_9TELE|nr:hypothetical protein EYF80_024997 [Liparis tanakae]
MKLSSISLAYLPESGKELRSAHSTSGMALISPETEDSLRLRVALSTMFFTSDRNIMVWTSLTSEYSGSQCMWALATRSSCFSMPWRDFPAESVYSQEASIISLRTSSSVATPMLSLVITLFSIASEPSEFAMASWLNSTKIAQPSTCLRSDSDIVLARDFGLKKPSYPCSFSSGKKGILLMSMWKSSWDSLAEFRAGERSTSRAKDSILWKMDTILHETTGQAH